MQRLEMSLVIRFSFISRIESLTVSDKRNTLIKLISFFPYALILK